jgi:hypothetical protein
VRCSAAALLLERAANVGESGATEVAADSITGCGDATRGTATTVTGTTEGGDAVNEFGAATAIFDASLLKDARIPPDGDDVIVAGVAFTGGVD